ncbi:MAG: BspA family leucine-rich repeat surface protein [Bacteroidaceae bacterium]|nr:BspA family leucine-rich repeat surface protein [Bacteroidaceae bacterium]
MKKHTLLYLCSLLFFVASSITPAHAQQPKGQYALYNYRNDGCFNAWLNVDIEKITYSCIDTLGIEHDDIVVQEVWTPDSVYRIPLEAIDSIGFRAPEPEMRDGLFYLREYHAAHTLEIDSLTLYFDTSINRDSMPAVGQVVLHSVFVFPYEEGFAGKVKSIREIDGRIKVDCDMICVGDVYKHLVIVGSASTKTESENVHRRAYGDPWIKEEDNGEINIPDIGDLTFKVLDGLLSVTSKKPSLNVKYMVYVDEDIYHMSANCQLTHNDLQFHVNFSLMKLLDIEDSDQIDKETKGIVEALKRMNDYKSMSEEEWEESFINEKIQKGNKEKLTDDEAKVLGGLWDKLHGSWIIPIYGPIVLELELGPLLKLKGDVEFDAALKTKGRNTFYVEAKGYTMATLANPALALATGLADINGSASFRCDPISSMSVGVKAKGSLSMGIIGKASLNLIHKSIVHATVSAQGGLKLSGAIEAKWDSDTPTEDLGFYSVLKDTKVKAEWFANAGVELGLTPWSFLTVGAEWEVFQSEIGSCYLFPHFTEPALPTYDDKKGLWSNGFKDHLILQSMPSKNIPDMFLGPCDVGLRIVDEAGKTIKEVAGREYRDDGMITWQIYPLEISLEGLAPGKTYRCFPILRYRDWKYLNATPSHEFTVPDPVNFGHHLERIIKKGENRSETIYGGWGLYKVESDNPGVVKASIHQNEGVLPYVIIEGLADGKATIKITDMYSGDEVTLPITVTNEPIPQITISVSHTEIDFGTVSQGGTMKRRFKVTNNGESSVTIQASCESTDFELSDNNTKVTLAKGESKDYIVTCNGFSTTDDVNAVIIITSDGSSESQSITLSARRGSSSGDAPAEAVDLGLPSGTKWASYNVGASKPEDYGGYYAWGETEEKEEYSASTYQYCDGTEETCHNLGNSICGTKYDVATVKWGEGWQMPSHTQFEELINNCTQTTATLNGIKGVRFTASNGNSIFIPAAGEHYGTETDGENDYGDYFTGTQYPTNYSVAYGFYFGYDGWGYEKKWNGHSIRPVYVEKNEDVQAEAYAVYEDGVFTFYCDVHRKERSGTTYDIPQEPSYPGWYENAKKVQRVIFDSSFAEARPKSTMGWFNGFKNTTQIDGLQYLNTSEVTSMYMMFYECSNLISLDLGNFNTENVTDMSDMFNYCSALKSLNVSNFDTKNVTNMSDMFHSCNNLVSIDISSFNTENVTNMTGMFCFCYALNSLNLSNFNTKKVTGMVSMFQGCKALTSLDLSHLNTDKVTTTSLMFSGCSSLTSLDLSSFNTESVWDMSEMFSDCYALHTIYCSSNWTTVKVSYSPSMFQGCSNLVGGKGTTYDSNYTEDDYAHIDGGPDNPGYFTDINAAREPIIVVNTQDIDFGLVEYGTDKTEKFTVTNTGTADLIIHVPQIRESGNKYFEISDVGKKFTLTSGQSKEYTVTCHGLQKGHWAEVDFRVLSNAENGTKTVNVKSVGWDNTPLLAAKELTMNVSDRESVKMQGTYHCTYEINNSNPEVVDATKGGDHSGNGSIGFDGYYGSALSYLNITALSSGTAIVKVIDSVTKEEAQLTITVHGGGASTEQEGTTGPGTGEGGDNNGDGLSGGGRERK